MVRSGVRAVDTTGWSTRELILLEASRLFATRGYLGTSTRDITTAVGIRQPSMYSHFASKQEIAEELLRRDLAAGITTLKQLAARAGGPAVELYRYLVWEVAHDLETPFDLRSLYVGEILDLIDFPEGRLLLRSYERLLTSVIRRGIVAGDFLDIDVTFAKRVVDAIVENTIRTSAAGEKRVRNEPDTAASFVIRALLTDPSGLAGVRSAAHESRN
jgi:AcrR family transcriptional regulator